MGISKMLNYIIKGIIFVVYVLLIFLALKYANNLLIPWLIFICGLTLILTILFVDFNGYYERFKENKQNLKLKKKWEQQSKTVIKFVEDYIKDK
jgi:putative effector of murein hydrolase